LGCDDANGHDGFNRIFNGHIGGENLFLGEKEEKALRRDKRRGDEYAHLRLLVEIGQFIGHEADDEVFFLWKFDQNGLTEGAFSGRRKRIGQLFGGEIDILHDRNIDKQVVSPADEFPAQHVGGDDPNDVEQNEEGNDPQPRHGKKATKKVDVNLGN